MWPPRPSIVCFSNLNSPFCLIIKTQVLLTVWICLSTSAFPNLCAVPGGCLTCCSSTWNSYSSSSKIQLKNYLLWEAFIKPASKHTLKVRTALGILPVQYNGKYSINTLVDTCNNHVDFSRENEITDLSPPIERPT